MTPNDLPELPDVVQKGLDDLDRTKNPERARFEDWYVVNAFDYQRDPIGSRDCSLQWTAWKAALAQREGTGDVADALERLALAWASRAHETGKLIGRGDPENKLSNFARREDLAAHEFRKALRAFVADGKS